MLSSSGMPVSHASGRLSSISSCTSSNLNEKRTKMLKKANKCKNYFNKGTVQNNSGPKIINFFTATMGERSHQVAVLLYCPV